MKKWKNSWILEGWVDARMGVYKCCASLEKKEKQQTLIMTKPIQTFFLWCSGADIELLKQCGPRDKIKYAGLGALILIPAILGFISMSYALSTKIDAPKLFLLGGGIWALIVFAIDRFIVSTFKKGQSITEDFFSFQFIGRLILAIGIGILVSHPLVLFFFEDTIHEKSIVLQNEEIEQLNETYKLKIDSIRKTTIKKYEDDKSCLRQVLTAEQSGFKKEVKCSNGEVYFSSGLPTCGKRCENIKKEMSDIDERIKEVEKTIDEVKERRDSASLRIQQNFSDDYLKKVEVLTALEEEDSHVTTVKLFLIFFFVLVDVLPVFLKMATKRSEYDDRVDSEKITVHIPPNFEREEEEKIKKKYILKMSELRSSEIDEIFSKWKKSISDFKDLKAELNEFINTKLKLGSQKKEKPFWEKVKKYIEDESFKLIMYLSFGVIQGSILFFFNNSDNLKYITIGTFAFFLLNFIINILVERLFKTAFKVTTS